MREYEIYLPTQQDDRAPVDPRAGSARFAWGKFKERLERQLYQETILIVAREVETL